LDVEVREHGVGFLIVLLRFQSPRKAWHARPLWPRAVVVGRDLYVGGTPRSRAALRTAVYGRSPVPAITARCEGLGPRRDWRRLGAHVGDFGLLARDLRDAHRIRSGSYVAKMGAVVEGHKPITLRVPRAARGRIGLIYGDAARGTRGDLSRAPVEVRFVPCRDRARSGYVGGLLLDGVNRPVTLQVQERGSRIGTLAVRPRRSASA
jgi:hypothetical protein